MTNKIMPKVNREGRRSFLQKSIAVVATVVVTRAFSAPNITLEKDTKPQPGTCILSVEQMAGPYIKSNMPIRRNIAENENGVPLLLKITVIDSNSCRPLEYYYVDIWQCNARGRYSGWSYVDPDKDAPSGEVASINRTDEKSFLRGSQVTDSHGLVRFTSIYPGFYAGRAVHIHFAIKPPKASPQEVDKYSFISQLYFPEEFNSEIEQRAEYSLRKIKRLINSDDEIFNEANGENAVLAVSKINENDINDGVLAEITIAINKDILSKRIDPKDILKIT
ncbi:Protocatechuate 3,4-dioxygenase beta subunit [Yersinia pseudotuberculosis]|nr:Protocatechuate 3,4-dioxygenase beta subunit [Yersinia pseudotuberculosis]